MIKQYMKDFIDMDLLQKTIYVTLLISLIIILIIKPIVYIFIGIGLLIFMIIAIFNNSKFQTQAVGNGIIFGGRGKGKGLLLNKRINTDKNKIHYTNVPYNEHSKLINIKEYIDSILPIITTNFINNNVPIIQKKHKYEGINVYWDDVGVYAPNFMDNELKKHYPSLSALLPINRHLYDAYMIITTQDINRPYKLLRELQTDFSIKAIKTAGGRKSKLWNAIPLLRFFITTKYIYYENTLTAVNGKLPFNAKSVINEGLKHGYLTSGQATKESYEAENGKISYGRIWQLKKHVSYDDRYFHEVVYGEKAPK